MLRTTLSFRRRRAHSLPKSKEIVAYGNSVDAAVKTKMIGLFSGMRRALQLVRGLAQEPRFAALFNRRGDLRQMYLDTLANLNTALKIFKSVDARGKIGAQRSSRATRLNSSMRGGVGKLGLAIHQIDALHTLASPMRFNDKRLQTHIHAYSADMRRAARHLAAAADLLRVVARQVRTNTI